MILEAIIVRHVIVISLLSIFLFAPFAYCARLNESDVLALAKEAAEKAGYKLEEYEEPKVRFKPTKNEWVATFYSKINPLVHFFVWVDDQTGRIHVMGGE